MDVTIQVGPGCGGWRTSLHVRGNYIYDSFRCEYRRGPAEHNVTIYHLEEDGQFRLVLEDEEFEKAVLQACDEDFGLNYGDMDSVLDINCFFHHQKPLEEWELEKIC